MTLNANVSDKRVKDLVKQSLSIFRLFLSAF